MDQQSTREFGIIDNKVCEVLVYQAFLTKRTNAVTFYKLHRGLLFYITKAKRCGNAALHKKLYNKE